MSTYGSLQGSFSSFSDDEKLNYALKIALSRLQTDLAADWFNEPTDFIPKQPLELYKNVIPSYASIQNFLLIDPDVDGNGKEMVTDKTVGDILSVSSNGSQFTLSDILDEDKVRNPSQFSSLSDSDFVDGSSRTQIKLLGRNMFTRYKYWTSGLTGKNSLLKGDAVNGGGGTNTGTTPDDKEPFNAYITYTDNGSLSDERKWDVINGAAENSEHKQFYNKLISEGVELNIIDPNLKSDLTKKHPFLKLCLQVLTYTTRGSTPIYENDNNSSSGSVEKTDNIGFHNPLMEKALGDTNGFLSGAGYQIAGWNGSDWKSVTTSYGTPGYQNILYFLSNPGFILVYGQKNIDYGYFTSRSHPPMITFMKYTGETFSDGIISQGDTLPAVEVSNDKDLFINTTENTIHRLKDDGVSKEWIPIGGSGNSDISFNDTKPSVFPDDFEENQLFVDTSNNIIFRVDDNGTKSFEQISEKILVGTGDPSGNTDGYLHQLYIRKISPPELYYNYGTKQWDRIGTGSGTGSSGTSGGTQTVDDQILTQTSEEIESVSNFQLLETNDTDIFGSSKAYTFPVGSTSLIYRFRFNLTWNNENNRGDTISEYTLKISSNDGTSWSPLKTFRLRNSVFSENFVTIEHVIKEAEHNDITNIKLVGKSINSEFKQKIHYSYFTTPSVVKPILELVTLGTRTIQAEQLFSKNTDSSIFYTTGNVGIGTDAPSKKLHIEANNETGAILQISRTDGNPASLYFGGDAGWGNITSSTHLSLKAGDTTSNGQTYNNNPQLFLHKDGNVGIGTTIPNSTLQVFGGLSVGNAVATSGNLAVTNNITCAKISASADQNIYSEFGKARIGATDNQTGNFATFSHIVQNTNNSYALKQDQNGVTYLNAKTGELISFRINNSEKMRLNDSGNVIIPIGNVGIGTYNPSEKLDVSGNINSSGTITSTSSGISFLSNYIKINQNDINPVSTRLVINATTNNTLINPHGGNVGIGILIPEKLLHIEAKNETNAILQISRTGTYPVSLYFGGNNGWGSITSDKHLSLKAGDNTGNGDAQSGQLFLHEDGNVGIGTDNPNSTLHIHNSSGNWAEKSTIRLSSDSLTHTYSEISYYRGTYYNSSADGNDEGLRFKHLQDNNTRIDLCILKNTGYVGVGENLPLFPLHVNRSTATEIRSVFAFSSTAISGAGNKNYYYEAQRDIGISIYANAAIACPALLSTSDERIKINIRDISDNISLQKLRDISCCLYEYKDPLSRNFYTQLGFIAQQVNKHLPLAISFVKDIIPNEMRIIENPQWSKIIDGSNNKFKLTIHDLEDVSGNTKYKFYMCNDISGNDECEKFSSTLEDERKSFIFDQSWNYVYLYGKEVDDFHRINKDKLFALNFSATQEIDRIQQQQLLDISGNTLNIAKNETDIELLKLENSELKTENADLKTELATLKTQMTDVLSRLSQLESN